MNVEKMIYQEAKRLAQRQLESKKKCLLECIERYEKSLGKFEYLDGFHNGLVMAYSLMTGETPKFYSKSQRDEGGEEDG